MLRVRFLVIAGAMCCLVCGCKCGQPKGPSESKLGVSTTSSEPATNPTTEESPIEGTFNAKLLKTGQYVVTLPHKTKEDKIKHVVVYCNTRAMQARHTVDGYFFDKVRLEKSPEANSAEIETDKIYGNAMQGQPIGTLMETTGSAQGDGDTFECTDNDSDQERFKAIAHEASEGMIFVRLINGQDKPHGSEMFSAYVKLELK